MFITTFFVFRVKAEKLIVLSDELFAWSLDYKALNVLDENFFFFFASLVQLSVCLVDVGLHHSELLHSPLFDINQKFDFLSGLFVQASECLLEFQPELRVVAIDKLKSVYCFLDTVGDSVGSFEDLRLFVFHVLQQHSDEVKTRSESTQSAISDEQVT